MVRVFRPASAAAGWELNPRRSRLPLGAATASPGDARPHNRTRITQTLYLAGPLSRADLARATGLTKVTVSALVADLLGEGLLEELGRQESQRPGKPAMLVDLARAAHAVIAIDLSNEDHFVGAVIDLAGRMLIRAEAPRGDIMGDAASDLVSRMALALRDESPLPLLGIGVGTPGIVDDAGVVRSSRNLGWAALPLRTLLEERTGLFTAVGNDANLAVLAEHAFGDTSDNLLLVRVGYGVGAGILLDGRPITGSRFASGEIGHVVVGGELSADAPYAREQVLEHRMSVPALRAALADAGAGVPAGADATPCAGAGPAPDAGTGAEARAEVLRSAGHLLGVALAPIVGLLNLEEIVLAGPPELLEGPLAEAALEVVSRRTMHESHDALTIRLTAQGDALILRGAAALVLRERLGIA